MSLYVIGIGGTGAKGIEAITHLASVGLLPTTEKIRIFFVDADTTNGNLERARATIGFYRDCYDNIRGNRKESPWMTSEIETKEVWSPFASSDQQNLKAFFKYNTLCQNNQALANLFDVLYTTDEQGASLDVGFRGRPAIGAGIMTQVDLDKLEQEPWRSFINQIKLDAGSGKKPKVFLIGSIFGGTGASGLPTIGRLIANKLETEGVRERVKIGGLFALPYFSFTATPEQKDKVYARPELFLLNTEAALRYYQEQAQQFDAVYLLGNQKFSQVDFSIGKGTQRNQPHFLELYTGLAARHLLLNAPAPNQVVFISRNRLGTLAWEDIPDKDAIRKELINATRFAYVWLSNMKQELADCKRMGVKKFQDGANWFTNFFRGEGFFPRGKDLPNFSDDQQQAAINLITNWCYDYLGWLSEIHASEGEQVEMFNFEYFQACKEWEQGKNQPQLNDGYLSDLVKNDPRDLNARKQDTVSKLKQELEEFKPQEMSPPNQGTLGLARALYIVCRI